MGFVRFIRMAWFQLIEFSRTTYFFQLVISTTVVAGIIQRIGVAAWGGDPYLGFVRTIAIGMWTLAATASGILGFERFKGTLVFLVSGRISSLAGLAPTVTACATFGLLAAPVSWLVWFPHATNAPALQLCAGLVVLWLSVVVSSYMIAAVFIATPNALAYEGLLLVPLLALSGIFDFTVAGYLASDVTRFFIPSAGAFRYLAAGNPVDAVIAMVVTGLWLVLVRVVANATLAAARRDATIDVV